MLKSLARFLAVGSLCGGFAIGVTAGFGCDDTSGNCPANAVGGRTGSGGATTGSGGAAGAGGSAGGSSGSAGGGAGSVGGAAGAG